MVIEFKFPDVGEGLTEGKLVNWKVAVGDTVAVDQVLAEVETDKAVVELPSPYAGTITKLYNQPGDTLIVGDVILTFDESGSTAPSTPEPVQETAPVTPPTQDLPRMAHRPVPPPQQVTRESSKEILALPAVWHYAKTQGIDLETITPTGRHGQITIADVQGVQVTPKKETPSPINSPQPTLQTPRPEVRAAPTPQQTVASSSTHDTSRMGNLLGSFYATPAVRRYAQSQGVDIHALGLQGEVTQADIDKVLGKTSSQQPIERAPIQEQETHTEELSSIRKVIARGMRESLDMAAPVTHVEEVDMTELVRVRTALKEEYAKKGVKLSYVAFVMKAVVAALKKHPVLNSSLDGEMLTYKYFYNIGFAVDTENGLFVPVVRAADSKSVASISEEIETLAAKAREKKLGPKDIQDSTFTITSVGSLGGISFTPIIHYPEAAILGVTRLRTEPRYVNGELTSRQLLNLCLTFDHRILDGADAARFVNTLKLYLEEPTRLLVENE